MIFSIINFNLSKLVRACVGVDAVEDYVDTKESLSAGKKYGWAHHSYITQIIYETENIWKRSFTMFCLMRICVWFAVNLKRNLGGNHSEKFPDALKLPRRWNIFSYVRAQCFNDSQDFGAGEQFIVSEFSRRYFLRGIVSEQCTWNIVFPFQWATLIKAFFVLLIKIFSTLAENFSWPDKKNYNWKKLVYEM